MDDLSSSIANTNTAGSIPIVFITVSITLISSLPNYNHRGNLEKNQLDRLSFLMKESDDSLNLSENATGVIFASIEVYHWSESKSYSVTENQMF